MRSFAIHYATLRPFNIGKIRNRVLASKRLLQRSCLLQFTVYGIPEILFWKIRNALLIYHTWYKRDFRKNTEISAMRLFTWVVAKQWLKELVRLHFQHCVGAAFPSSERAHHRPRYPPTSAKGFRAGDSLTTHERYLFFGFTRYYTIL